MASAEHYARVGRELTTGSKWSNMVKGAMSTFEGTGILLRSPSLVGVALLYAVVALSILVLLLIGMGVFAVWLSGLFVDTLVGWTGELSETFYSVVSWLSILTLFAILLFPTLVIWRVVRKVFTSRIRERLSQNTQRLLRPDLQFTFLDGATFAQELIKAPMSISVGTIKALFMSVGLLIINLVPVIGQVISVSLSVFLSAREMGDDLLATSAAGKNHDERALKAFKARTPGLWFGVGAGATLLSLVPVLNVLTLPGSVIGAAHLFLAVEAVSPSDDAAQVE